MIKIKDLKCSGFVLVLIMVVLLMSSCGKLDKQINKKEGTINAKGGSSSNVLWERLEGGGINGDLESRGNDVAIDQNGNTYVIGEFIGSMFVVKYDQFGNKLWENFVQPPTSGRVQGIKIKIGPNGAVYALGHRQMDVVTFSNEKQDILCVKYHPIGGHEEGRVKYSGMSRSSTASPSDMAIDANGNVFITGSVGIDKDRDGKIDDRRFLTLKYNHLLQFEWDKIVRQGGSGVAIGIDSTQNIYVSGISGSALTLSDILTVKYGNNGTELWRQVYSSAALYTSDKPLCLTIDKFDNVYVVGEIVGPIPWPPVPTQHVITLKYNSFGVLSWTKLTPVMDLHGHAVGIDVANTGDVYLSYDRYLQPNYERRLVKYSATGVQVWEKKVTTFYGPVFYEGVDELPVRVVNGNRQGTVHYIYTLGKGDGDYSFVAKYAQNGELIWQSKFADGMDGYPIAMEYDEVNGEGPFVTGIAHPGLIKTVKYVD
ncbi:MAG: hypothetical protein HQ564_07640 [Candidatus Saganbacteria bacterium]|nr:hypothetical protein [Candidatus Saganbacteria bacterium]